MSDFQIRTEDDLLVARRTSDNAYLGATQKPRHARDLARTTQLLRQETTQQLAAWEAQRQGLSHTQR